MLKTLLRKQMMEIFRSYFYDAKKNRQRSKASTAMFIVLFAFLMVGVLGAKRYIPGGLGLFGLPGYIDAGSTGLFSMWVVLAASVLAFVIALAGTLVLYKED